ncbi:UDP-glucose 4-epimerase GalE [Hoeflea sp. G2-23]|uniref:UDP-glucose 4-epimerase n=1 Tax=Hoeflea algicola TaxID=2983763 RepID=A0ABT3ZD04_9HYPH|nr:UDP-glucose 4-epimerase GalE [Hoeflea algicola]MCY0149677.1 UDP-glucose 4-epimerase GalE [Hoeflea algicola]
MTVLVTGGAGYIGSHMVWKLLDRNEQVVVIDDLSTGHAWAVPDGVAFVHADVADKSALDRIFSEHQIDAVFHFAGAIIVPESVEFPLKYYRENASKTGALIDHAIERRIAHFIYSSSAAVYGAPGMDPVTEAAPCAPESPYGTSKLVTEWMLRDVAAANPAFRYAALRYFNVAGADPDMRSGQSSRVSTHLIKIAAEAAVGKRDGVSIFGDDFPTPDGTCVRDYIHVSDLVEAHYQALVHLRAGGPSIIANCGYGSGYSVRQVIEAVKAVSGVDFEAIIGPRRPGDAAMIVADSTLARTVLNWSPQLDDLETIIRHALEWERRLAEQGPKTPSDQDSQVCPENSI